MPDNKNTKSSKPFVKEGTTLNFAKALKEKGLWPPRLHRKGENDNDGKKPTATPFLLIPSTFNDNGSRPLPNSKVFYSKGIWLENIQGNPIAIPVIGGEYKIKCQILNLGAFASYGGMANFFIAKPGDINAAAGTSVSIPLFGITGFSVLPGLSVTITCPKNWKPLTAGDLLASIVVHAYDPLADNIVRRFDARNDRHVGRHDYTSDFYVRDWTTTTAIHDNGEEPSAERNFYTTSDIWNKRTNNPGNFTNDQAINENPQSGNGTAGDNFVFARISRSNTTTQEIVKAHFLFAEFGTGSPFVDCCPLPDPSVTFLVGEDKKIISLPWHLLPSSSTHLCMAVQVYSDGDTFMPPGLSGYTPGWPTTDLMVINDNNKAQRNMYLWDGVPEQPSAQFAIIKNSATFVRNFELKVSADEHTVERLKNARVRIPYSNLIESFKSNNKIILENMLPGENRLIALEYDGFSTNPGETLQVSFNEVVNEKVINGFTLGIKAVSVNEAVLSALEVQRSIFFRMAEGMGVKSANEALAFTEELLKSKPDTKAYLKTLQKSTGLLYNTVVEMSGVFDGLKDSLGVTENIRLLNSFNADSNVSKVVALHLKLLNQLDAWQTMAIKSKGDEADILFTVRLQKDVYSNEELARTQFLKKLVDATNDFISKYSLRTVINKDYSGYIRSLMDYFKQSVEILGGNVMITSLGNLVKSVNEKNLAGIQKAHLAFLNDLLRAISV